MTGIALLLLLFICVSSIFIPAWRTLALCIIATAITVIGGCWLIIELAAH